MFEYAPNVRSAHTQAGDGQVDRQAGRQAGRKSNRKAGENANKQANTQAARLAVNVTKIYEQYMQVAGVFCSQVGSVRRQENWHASDADKHAEWQSQYLDKQASRQTKYTATMQNDRQIQADTANTRE